MTVPFASWRTFHLPEPRTLVCALLGREYCSGYRVSRKEKRKQQVLREEGFYRVERIVASNERSRDSR